MYGPLIVVAVVLAFAALNLYAACRVSGWVDSTLSRRLREIEEERTPSSSEPLP